MTRLSSSAELPPSVALHISGLFATLTNRNDGEEYSWMAILADGSVRRECDGATWSREIGIQPRFHAPAGLVRWLVLARSDRALGASYHALHIPPDAEACFMRRRVLSHQGGPRTAATIIGEKSADDARHWANYWYFGRGGLLLSSDHLDAM